MLDDDAMFDENQNFFQHHQTWYIWQTSNEALRYNKSSNTGRQTSATCWIMKNERDKWYTRTCLDNLSNCLLNGHLKNSGGLNRIRTNDLCDSGDVLYQLSYEATQLRVTKPLNWQHGNTEELMRSELNGQQIYLLPTEWLCRSVLHQHRGGHGLESRCMEAPGIAHFQVAACLSFKASPGAQPFEWKWVGYSYANRTHFPCNSWAPRLTSKPRQTATRKWPIFQVSPRDKCLKAGFH